MVSVMVLEGVGPVPLTVTPTENSSGALLMVPLTEKLRSPTTKISSLAEGMVYEVAAAPVGSRNPAPTIPVSGGIDELLLKMPVRGSTPGPVVPVAPVGRVLPVGPVGPVSPVGPVGPVLPVAPVLPVLPVGPVGPVSPVGPVLPVGPVGPVSPVG